jgi:hypothetical protein
MIYGLAELRTTMKNIGISLFCKETNVFHLFEAQYQHERGFVLAILASA